MIFTKYRSGQIKSSIYFNAAGKHHRDPTEGPAISCWFENGQRNYQYYYVDGKLHRDPLEGPAYESWDRSGKRRLEEYYVDGKEVPKPEVKVKKEIQINPIEGFYPNGQIQYRYYRNSAGSYHRESTEGPAAESWYDNGQKWYQHYYVDGKLHRDPSLGPALETYHENGHLQTRQYFVDGKFHRDPLEGPAYEMWYESGQSYSKEYAVDGKNHRDPDLGPAYESFRIDGKTYDKRYYVNGKFHRDPLKGPACEFWNENDMKTIEHYYVDGKAVPKPESKVENVVEIRPQETYFPNGNICSRIYRNAAHRFHREPGKGPSYEEWHESGRKASAYYHVDGKRHRDPLEGPALETYHENGHLQTRQYFVDGNFHRDPLQGPAYESWNDSGKKHSESYYVDGKEVPKPELKADKEIEVKPIETFYNNGKIRCRSYINAAGKYHRDPLEGPAYESWHENGQKWSQEYWVDGNFHREQGPAISTWNTNGIKANHSYVRDGKRHRDPNQGSAYQAWDENGKLVAELYYVDGKIIIPKPELVPSIQSDKLSEPEVKTDSSDNLTSSIVGSMLIASFVAILCKNKNTVLKSEKKETVVRAQEVHRCSK